MSMNKSLPIELVAAIGGAVGALLLREGYDLWKSRDGTVACTQEEETAISSAIGSKHPFTSLQDKYGECIYMDYNATTPIWPEVTAAMEPFTSVCFGNPSSPHVFAKPCQQAIDSARQHVARLIHASTPDSIIFTSCGSEADNRAIDIAIESYTRSYPADAPIPHVVTTAIEHPAVLEYLAYLSRENRIELTILSVSEDGFVSVDDVISSLKATTALVTIMHSNNEVGTIQPIKCIGEKIEEYNKSHHMKCIAKHKVLFHSDGAQSLGKVLIDVKSEYIDMLTIVGHKFGAPKGIAALYVKPGIGVKPFLYGGGQEGGRRAGTENVLLIVGIGEASRIAYNEAKEMMVHLLQLKERFVQSILKAFPVEKYGRDFVRFNGPSLEYDEKHLSLLSGKIRSLKTKEFSEYPCLPTVLPNTVSVGFKNILASDLIEELKSKVACSAGTTCHAADSRISAVLTALQVPPCYGRGTLRISFGRHTTTSNIDAAVDHIAVAVAKLTSPH